jgi:ribonuclease D
VQRHDAAIRIQDCADLIMDMHGKTVQYLEFTLHKTVPDKAEIALLDPFEGLPLERIFVPATVAAFEAAAADIRAAKVVGFDTESKPTFIKGEASSGPHVVQFALPDKAYLFLLHRTECHPFVIGILQSEEILKAGFGLQSDKAQILSKLGVTLNAVLDLGSEFRRLGYPASTGVRGAVAIVFNKNFRKSRSATTSNWAQPVLSSKQLLYAANDAYAALCVLNALKSGLILGM